ncbi:MAG: YceI family protein [Bacteroidetes bacterium]|nr:YceI family protein [Bacteroidota bacterium]
MKNGILSLSLLLLSGVFVSFTSVQDKRTSTKNHVYFFSHTDLEDITANNYKAVSTLDTKTGEMVYSIPMQSFEFKKALMQKHFNSKGFLDTKTYPKAKFVGKINNLGSVDFTKDGIYQGSVTGIMTIKGISKSVTESGSIEVKGNSINVKSKFKLILADYGITFSKGKPSTNVAKTVDVSVISEY